VEVERRGQKIKKKPGIDPMEAETVRLIYKLYLDGDGSTGRLGVKETTKWLNGQGRASASIEKISVRLSAPELI